MNYGTELVGMLIALAVGLVIGFERGWRSQNLDEERHEEIDDQTVTGIRTFGLLGLAGGVVAQWQSCPRRYFWRQHCWVWRRC